MADHRQDDDPDRVDDGHRGERSGAGADAVQAGLAQFQQAALDAIRAARTMLEAAESVVQDPAAVEAVVQTVAAYARQAGETVAGFAGAAGGAWPPRRADVDDPGPGARGADDDGPDDDPDDGVTRIRVG